MGSPRLFTCPQAPKMGYFYWLRVKNSDHPHTELSLGYLEDAEFYPESLTVGQNWIPRVKCICGDLTEGRDWYISKPLIIV